MLEDKNNNRTRSEDGTIRQIEKDYEEYKAQGRIWGGVSPDSIRIKFPRIEKKIIDEFLALEDLTGSISDVLDSLGIRVAVPASHLMPLMPTSKIAGTAITLRSIPERKTVTKGLIDKDYIRMATRDTHYLAEPGDILVADFGGNLEVSNMGGQSVAVAQSRGVVGAIVNGAVRNVPSFRKRDMYEAAARQKSASILLCQDDCKAADSAVISFRDATFAQKRDRMLAGTRNTNPHKSNRPAKLKRLPTSSCIGNAPAINCVLHLGTTALSHSRYNADDFPTWCRGTVQKAVFLSQK